MTEKRTDDDWNVDEGQLFDGNYVIAEVDGDIFLTVFPPVSEPGRPVRAGVVINELRTRFGKKLDDNHPIHMAVQSAAGVAVKIYDHLEMETAPEIYLQISPDRTLAQISVTLPRRCRPLTLEDLQQALRKGGVTFGIDQEAMKRLVERQMGGETVCARGIKPVKGRDASLKIFVDTTNKGRPEELDDGRVDYKEIHLYTMVEKGQLLAERIPATVGEAGMDVFGNKIPAPNGHDVSLPTGKNLQIVDKNRLEAAEGGHYVYDGVTMNVFPVIEIKGDVDFSSGNVDFSGSVVVRGSVNTGFSVKAEGSVDVFGNVIGGTVEAQAITVRAGIQGRSVIRASQQVIAKFIENSSVHCGDAVVNDVILHGQVIAERRVVVSGRRGIIAGGQVVAGEEIKAMVLGTTSGVQTKITVGQKPLLRDEYFQLMKDIQQMETQEEENSKSLTLLNAMDLRTMSPQKQELRNKLSASQYYHQQQIKDMRNRVHEIEIAFEEMSGATVKATKSAYPGVVITIGNQIEPVREVMKGTLFCVENGVLKMEAYNEKTAKALAAKKQ
ncbi:MAG TPA: FapA family protein [Patescibacteria group bacterium]|nr:FapA family protein [Patescibacteria group bacterium]